MFRCTNMKIKHTFAKKTIIIHTNTHRQMSDSQNDKIVQSITVSTNVSLWVS